MFSSIAIVGSGAIGLYYGGRLAEHGHDVRFLLRGDFDAMQRWITTPGGPDIRMPRAEIEKWRAQFRES